MIEAVPAYKLVGARAFTPEERRRLNGTVAINPIFPLVLLVGSLAVACFLMMIVLALTILYHLRGLAVVGFLVLPACLAVPFVVYRRMRGRGKVLNVGKLLTIRSADGRTAEVFRMAKGVFRAWSIDGVEQSDHPLFPWTLEATPGPSARASGTRVLSDEERDELEARFKWGDSHAPFLLAHLSLLPAFFGFQEITKGRYLGSIPAILISAVLVTTLGLWLSYRDKRVALDLAERTVQCRPDGLEFLPHTGVVWRQNGVPASWRASLDRPNQKEVLPARLRGMDGLSL